MSISRWLCTRHDYVIKWIHFPRYWLFVRGIHRSPVNSPHKGQWHGALMFSLICVWINDWVNTGEAGDLRRYRAHYAVTVMGVLTCFVVFWHQSVVVSLLLSWITFWTPRSHYNHCVAGIRNWNLCHIDILRHFQATYYTVDSPHGYCVPDDAHTIRANISCLWGPRLKSPRPTYEYTACVIAWMYWILITYLRDTYLVNNFQYAEIGLKQSQLIMNTDFIKMFSPMGYWSSHSINIIYNSSFILLSLHIFKCSSYQEQFKSD